MIVYLMSEGWVKNGEWGVIRGGTQEKEFETMPILLCISLHVVQRSAAPPSVYMYMSHVKGQGLGGRTLG